MKDAIDRIMAEHSERSRRLAALQRMMRYANGEQRGIIRSLEQQIRQGGTIGARRVG